MPTYTEIAAFVAAMPEDEKTGIVRRVFLALYGDYDGPEPVIDLDREWSPETLEEIAGILGHIRSFARGR